MSKSPFHLYTPPSCTFLYCYCLIVRRYAQRDDLQLILLWLSAVIIVSFADAVLFSISLYWFDNTSLNDIFWDGFIADITGNIFATTVIMGLINPFQRVVPSSKLI